MRRTTLLALALLCLIKAEVLKAEVLISAQEAAYPPLPESETTAPFNVRAVSRAPEAQMSLISNGSKVLKSPINFKVKFIGHGGTLIDPALTHVIYLKDPSVDLTSRLQKYTQASGIEMPNAEIPPGNHIIRIELTDTNGHEGWSILTLVIDK